jgi:hypothetical protein
MILITHTTLFAAAQATLCKISILYSPTICQELCSPPVIVLVEQLSPANQTEDYTSLTIHYSINQVVKLHLRTSTSLSTQPQVWTKFVLAIYV